MASNQDSAKHIYNQSGNQLIISNSIKSFFIWLNYDVMSGVSRRNSSANDGRWPSLEEFSCNSGDLNTSNFQNDIVWRQNNQFEVHAHLQSQTYTCTIRASWQHGRDHGCATADSGKMPRSHRQTSPPALPNQANAGQFNDLSSKYFWLISSNFKSSSRC